ncbi:MAG: sigma-54-dependent Fis family transcriptional regulator [Deltaproteobacteria bacterium]|nr:sigma-54-dependent Fis family transcriptional regulator [Deltaproteobacteria bacterium]
MNSKPTVSILIVDDHKEMRDFLQDILSEQGYRVATAASADEALERLASREFHLVITDIKMPGMDGVGLLEQIKTGRGFSPFVILITAFGDINDTIRFIDKGAYDYIIKPFKMEQILIAVKRAERELQMRQRVRELEDRATRPHRFQQLLGKSPVMQQVFSLIEKVAAAEGSVLIEGETGTGKELIAQAIHRESPRKKGPFVPINCASIPEGLLESELFGHTRGAFTGASDKKQGLFVAADGGTLFLDEIGEMPPSLQAKLLRAIQERRVRPVGSTSDITFDVRIVSATNCDLRSAASEGRFREDIFYRLATFQIKVPPLRQRREDIPLLIEHFLAQHAAEGRDIFFSPEVLRALVDYSWPGNVRELRSLVERCIYLCAAETVQLDDLPEEIRRQLRPENRYCLPEDKTLATVELEYILFSTAVRATGSEPPRFSASIAKRSREN